MSGIFTRLQQSLGLSVDKFDDPVVPVRLGDRVVWVLFGSYHRTVTRYWYVVPIVLLAWIIVAIISRIVVGWMTCVECNACIASIPEQACGATYMTNDRGPLFCLKTGFAGIAPRIGETIRSNKAVLYFDPRNLQVYQKAMLSLGSDIPCLTNLLHQYHFSSN